MCVKQSIFTKLLGYRKQAIIRLTKNLDQKNRYQVERALRATTPFFDKPKDDNLCKEYILKMATTLTWLPNGERVDTIQMINNLIN